jgi:tetratricopeptide (TPR) repeat protein
MADDPETLPTAKDAPTLEALARAYVAAVRAREDAARTQAARTQAAGHAPRAAVTFAPVKLPNDSREARATNRAFELYKMRQDEDAEAALDAVLEAPGLAQPIAVRAYVRRALVRTRRGALDDARADLEAALALAPKDGPAHYDLALVAFRQGAGDAAAHLTAALAADPETYRRALAADPDFDPYRAACEPLLRGRG